MSLETELEDLNLCRAYLHGQLKSPRQTSTVVRRPQPGSAITISFQAGADAHELARQLAGILQKAEPKGICAWTVFDRQLVEKVLEEHHLPKALADRIPEDRRSYIKDVMEELVGLRSPSWVIVPQVAETILHLVEMWRVIVVGHGASVITARMPNVFMSGSSRRCPSGSSTCKSERTLARRKPNDSCARRIVGGNGT